MFVEGKPRTVFFPPDTLFITFVATVQTRLEHMILGQLRMGERQMTSAPLDIAEISNLYHIVRLLTLLSSNHSFHDEGTQRQFKLGAIRN